MGLSWIVKFGGHRPPLQKSFTVVADRQRRADFHGTLRGGGFFIVFRLLKEIHSRLVLVIFQKVRRLIETHATRRARRIDVPRSRNVLGLFACFVRHEFSFTRFADTEQFIFWVGTRLTQKENDEARMTNDEGRPNAQMMTGGPRDGGAPATVEIMGRAGGPPSSQKNALFRGAITSELRSAQLRVRLAKPMAWAMDSALAAV
jgi:hypothetical protein